MTIGLRRVSTMRAIGIAESPGTLDQLISLGDGRRVVARDDWGAVLLVDVEAGEVVSRLVPGEDEAEVDAIAVVGGRVVTVRNTLLEIWDPIDFSRPLRTIARKGRRASAACSDADGRSIAILDEGVVEIWHLEAGVCLRRWSVSDDAFALDVNGDELYVHGDHSFEVFAWDSGKPRAVGIRKAAWVCVHPDGRVLVEDGSAIKICARTLADDEDEDDTFSCMPSFHDACHDIALLDAERAVSVHRGGAILLFEVAAGRALAVATDASRNPWTVVALSPTRFAVSLGGGDGALELWEVVDDAADSEVAWLGFTSLLPSGDDQVVARTRGGGSLVFDLMTGRALGSLPHARRALFVDEHAVVGTNSSMIIRFDRATGDALGSIYDHALDGAHGVHSFARSGSLIGGCVYDNQHFDLIDLSVQDDGWTRIEQPGGVVDVAFDADAVHAFVSCADGSVAVWRLSDRAHLRTLACRPCEYLHVGDTWLATRDEAGRVATFDIVTGALLVELPGTYVYARGALVTADAAGEIVRWDPRTGTRRDAWHAGHPLSAIATTRSGHVAWLDRRGELHIRH